ncbi:hypothetical protein [Escherichia phage vB_EcoM_PD205]|nr:hypothetical protein [Escherichia phage vB_EcoM_PD205]
MKDMFAQGGSGSAGIKTNKQAIARHFGVKQSDVVYFSPGVPLTGYKVIYDKESQRAYSLPTDIGSRVTAVSLSTAGVLVHSAGNVDLGELAVTRGEYVTLPGSFDTGVTVNTKNELVVFADGKYRWDGELPKVVPADSTPDSTGEVKLGAWVGVGDAALRGDIAKFDYKDKSFEDSLLKRPYIFESVSEMIAADFTGVKDGAVVKTLKNEFGLTCESTWRIASSQLETTYNVSVSGGRYAQLVIEPEMSFASFGFGGNDIQNAAAVTEGNRVARANPIMHTLRFPAGAFNIGAFTLDVDRRGFTWDGAGWDGTYLTSTSNGISMHHILIDPRNRARDRDHYYQTVKGFTIDGNISGVGSAAAQRTVCSAHYSNIAYKSVGHILSNVDLCGLVINWRGLTGGRTVGATRTSRSVRARYNSIKIDGYIGGSTDNAVALEINGPITTLAAAANIGDTTITVSSAVGFSVHDIIEIAGGTLDAKIIIGISGNTLTLDSGLNNAHTNAATVRVPVFGTSVTGTIEVGQIQIGNSNGTELRGAYAEQSKIYIYGWPSALEIHGNTLGQAAPQIQIDQVNRLSTIRIVCNDTAFPIAVNVAERATGAVNANLDLYNFPELDISQNTRAQSSILVNGIYPFKSLRTERFYDSSINDRAFTSFKFTGFSATQNPATSTEILRFAQDAALRGYDGHSYSISATIRRNTGLSGLIERKGQTSNIGGVISDTTTEASRTLSSYAFFDPTNGMDILIGSNTGRMGIVLKGEPSSGQAIKAMISGEIVSVI